MKIELDDKTIEKLASRIVEMSKETDEKELISTIEAARLLRVSPDRMRKIKDKYPHIKVGQNGQSRILFYKSGFEHITKP